MKRNFLIVIGAICLICSYTFAEDVESHLFDDLNSNQISDTAENRTANQGGEEQSSSSQAVEDEDGVEDIHLPDTPPE